MLTLTDSAATEIRTITAAPEIPDDAGVRIATTPDGAGLTLSLAASPVDGDAVVEDNGARVFLEPTAAGLLDDKSLDAVRDPSDAAAPVQFAIAEQVG